MYYLNCTRRDESGRILERFKAPATHFFKLIADNYDNVISALSR